MKVVIGSIAAATAASACCLGPVVFSLVGAGGRGRPYGTGRTLLWIATGTVMLIAMFPYYMT